MRDRTKYDAPWINMLRAAEHVPTPMQVRAMARLIAITMESAIESRTRWDASPLFLPMFDKYVHVPRRMS